MKRRDILKGVVSAPFLSVGALGWVTPGWAQQDWPNRTITMIVPFPPGGQADLAARPVAAALEKILGRPVVVDNRAGGGGGAVGNAAAARANPDGYTLLLTLSSLAVLPEADRLFGRPPTYEVSQLLRSPAFWPTRQCSQCRPRPHGRRWEIWLKTPRNDPARYPMAHQAPMAPCTSRWRCSQLQPASSSCMCHSAGPDRL